MSFLVFPCYHGNYFLYFLAHVLNWGQTYHHAKFERNSPTGLARMIILIYRQKDRQAGRQTNRQTDISFYIYSR